MKKGMFMKWSLLPLLLITSLQAGATSSEDLSSIYMEAVLFIGIFGTMGIISFFISRKQANKYVKENPVIKEEPLSKLETRMLELSRLLKNGILTEEEFQVLKRAKEAV